MNHECCRTNWNGYSSSILRLLLWILGIFWKCHWYILGGNFYFWIWIIFGWFMPHCLKQMSQKKFTFDDLTDCFIKGSNNCDEAFVSAFKPLYLQNMILSYIRNNYEHCILKLVPKFILFMCFLGEKQRFVGNLTFLPLFS